MRTLSKNPILNYYVLSINFYIYQLFFILQGDSGGPLLCQAEGKPDKWFVGGIVSWGVKCANPFLPGIYANIPRFIPWIERQLKLYSELRKY